MRTSRVHGPWRMSVISAAIVMVAVSSAMFSDAAAPALGSGPAKASQTAKRVSPPTTVAPPGPVSAGRPWSASSPWNTPTPAGTSWYDTSVLHSLAQPVNGDSRRHWWVSNTGVGVYQGTASDPLWTFNLPGLNDTYFHRVHPAATFSVRAPAGMQAGAGSDKVLFVVNGTTYYEVWLADIDPGTRTVTGQTWSTGDYVSGPGAGSPNSDGVRAANFSWAGGLITGRDMANGTIDHALALTLTSDTLDAFSGKFRFPATAWDNGGANGPIQMGSRIGVPAGVARPAGLSPVGVMMFDALQTYGAFVGDFGGGQLPVFFADSLTVSEAQVLPIYAYWTNGGSSDMDKIGPLLRVADYQP